MLSVTVIESCFSSKFYDQNVQAETYVRLLFSVNVTAARPGIKQTGPCEDLLGEAVLTSLTLISLTSGSCFFS